MPNDDFMLDDAVPVLVAEVTFVIMFSSFL